jgi:hypothetical protein
MDSSTDEIKKGFYGAGTDYKIGPQSSIGNLQFADFRLLTND